MKNLARHCSARVGRVQAVSAGSECRQRSEVFHFCADYTIGKQTLRGRSAEAVVQGLLSASKLAEYVLHITACIGGFTSSTLLPSLQPTLVLPRIAHSSSCGLCWFLFPSFIWHLNLENSIKVYSSFVAETQTWTVYFLKGLISLYIRSLNNRVLFDNTINLHN